MMPVNPSINVTSKTPDGAIHSADNQSVQSNIASEGEKKIGKWLYKHRHDADTMPGYLGYQIFRNMCAAVPYGIATAATWMGFEKVATMAEKNLAKGETSLIAQAARSPLRDIAMIAAGFTLFRGTLKMVRYMKESLFNPNHSEEQTIKEVQHFKENIKDSLKEIAPAEIASTPAAAIVLGIGRRFWNPKTYLGEHATTHGVRGVFSESFAKEFSGKRWDRIKNVFSKKGGYLAEAGIIATSFVPFFELGDRRFKDAQVARGLWLNDPSSLVRKNDEQAKAELKEGQAYLQAGNRATEEKKIVAADAPQQNTANGNSHIHHATNYQRPSEAPTLSNFAMRRVVPTFMGIGAYVAGKRLAYLGMGTMPEHNVNGRSWLKNLGMMALVEGAATSLFWLNSAVIDKFEPWYDNIVNNKPAPLNDQQMREHYEQLQARLDAKEQDRNANVRSIG